MQNKPKILIYDIETSPNLGWYFNLYQEGNILKVEDHWHMLSFSWKFLGDKKTHVLCLADFPDYKKDKENDKQLTAALWGLFNEADIVIAHNGNSFDQKKSNARFIAHGFKPPAPYKQIDTKLVAKKYFKFDSNKLDDLGAYLGLGRKLETGGKELWFKCMDGDKKSWKLMCDYNKQDVILLEKVYLKLLPWMTDHPNVALLTGQIQACPNCASFDVHKRGLVYTRTRTYQRYQCQSCFAWSQAPREGLQVR